MTQRIWRWRHLTKKGPGRSQWGKVPRGKE